MIAPVRCGRHHTNNEEAAYAMGRKGSERSARPVADNRGSGTTALQARSEGAMPGHFLSRLWRTRAPRMPTGEDASPAVQFLRQPHAPPTTVSTASHPWPRLSESLTGPKQPGVCQSCGATNAQLVPSADPNNEMSSIAQDDGAALHARLKRVLDADERGVHVWQECDDADRREPIAVLLCPPCSDRLIKPHPRLYSGLPFNEPVAGTMELCAPCRFRDGVGCTHPDLTANGGTGLMIQADTPVSVPGRPLGRGQIYVRAAMGCAGRVPIGNETWGDTVSAEVMA